MIVRCTSQRETSGSFTKNQVLLRVQLPTFLLREAEKPDRKTIGAPQLRDHGKIFDYLNFGLKIKSKNFILGKHGNLRTG